MIGLGIGIGMMAVLLFGWFGSTTDGQIILILDIDTPKLGIISGVKSLPTLCRIVCWL